jgi:3-hydroxyisobutyrate dehydrogenase/2-hydroxy-3-oxopropionate reductase
MSTASPAALRRLEAALPPGAGLLDAPVLGSVAEVEAGTLRIFAGGTQATVDRCAGPLAALGTVEHVGPVGAGTAAKLVANATLFGVLGVLGEALALARRLGLPPAATREVLAATPLAAQAERRRPAVESGDYPTRFALPLAVKDADLILSAAADAGADLRLVTAACGWLAGALAEDPDRDYTAVLAHILDRHPPRPAPGSGHDDTARR